MCWGTLVKEGDEFLYIYINLYIIHINLNMRLNHPMPLHAASALTPTDREGRNAWCKPQLRLCHSAHHLFLYVVSKLKSKATNKTPPQTEHLKRKSGVAKILLRHCALYFFYFHSKMEIRRCIMEHCSEVLASLSILQHNTVTDRFTCYVQV